MSARHIAILAPPVPGHYDPLKVLAQSLQAHGHRITFVHMLDAGALATEFGFEAVGDTPDQFAAFLKTDRELAAKKVQASGAKLD